MISAIRGLDHVLVGVHDLAAARHVWRELGFTITPRGRHIGWGTANYCIMFPDDYIELLGILDPTQFVNNLDRFLETREGLLGVALASDDAAAVAAQLAETGISADGPKDLARTLELPEGEVRPAFRLVHPDPAATPGVSAFVCEHRTRDLVWNPAWLDHPNGARGLNAVTAVVDDPSALVPAYGRIFGADRVRADDDGLAVETGSAELRFVTPERLPDLNPFAAELPDYPRPWTAALSIAVADPDRIADSLAGASVSFEPLDGGLVVPPGEATGVALEFVTEVPKTR